MRWVGLGLALGGVVVALIAGFGCHSLPWVIGGVAFCIIGIIILFLYRNSK